VETADGEELVLSKGGTVLAANGKTVTAEPMAEYEAIYARFAELLKSGKSEIDGAALQLVGDCFMLGRRVAAEAFV
jgi:D-galactose 1-dehydrogenase